jgi:D-3-phosphoglycerate dehydrogenase / 2-oxoglutarate reductase
MSTVYVPDTEAGERMQMADRLSALPGVSVRLGQRFSTPPDEVTAGVIGADVLCVALARVDAAVFKAADRLRLVVKCGIGTESIDLDAARATGVGVVRTSGVNVYGAAEYVIASALMVGRRLPELDADVRAGRWAEARLALGHGMAVLASDPFVDPASAAAAGAELVSLERLLAEADVVAVHVVLDESTHHLFGADQFAAMKPTALFVNASRGGIVDTAALADALRSGAIAHAVVDVLEEEPPEPDNPLLELENCTLTPHLGGCTDHGYDEIGALAAELIELYLSGAELPASCVVVAPGPRA